MDLQGPSRTLGDFEGPSKIDAQGCSVTFRDLREFRDLQGPSWIFADL